VNTETRDDRRYSNVVRSEEMRAIMRRFSKAHAIGIHINLITVISKLWFGFVLA